MSYLAEYWWAITVGVIAVLTALASITRLLFGHRGTLKELAAEIMDERQGQGGRFSIIGGAVLTGHYRGRRLKLSMQEGGENWPQLTLQLSCSAPPAFLSAQPRGALGKAFGVSPGMLAGAAGVPDSLGFLLERSGVMPRRLFGIDMGGGTGLPPAPIGDPAFDGCFCLSASEPARDAVLAWMREPGVKEQVESLFSAERLALLTPTLDKSGEIFLAAAVRKFRDTDLEPANVRSLLDQLEVIAKSLEKQ